MISWTREKIKNVVFHPVMKGILMILVEPFPTYESACQGKDGTISCMVLQYFKQPGISHSILNGPVQEFRRGARYDCYLKKFNYYTGEFQYSNL